MTRLVNQLLEQGIAELEQRGEAVSESTRGEYRRRQKRQKEKQ